MRNSESFAFDSMLAADELLRRLEADALDWNEARLSDRARAAGVYGFWFRRSGNTFRVRALIGRQGPNHPPMCDGVVTSLVCGSRVAVTFRLPRHFVVPMALWLCVAVTMIVVPVVIASVAAAPRLLLVGVVAAGMIAACGVWSWFLVRLAWRYRELARDETLSLLYRASSPLVSRTIVPPNKPLERSGAKPPANIPSPSAGRSAPSR